MRAIVMLIFVILGVNQCDPAFITDICLKDEQSGETIKEAHVRLLLMDGEEPMFKPTITKDSCGCFNISTIGFGRAFILIIKAEGYETKIIEGYDLARLKTIFTEKKRVVYLKKLDKSN